ncbi:deoxyribodipyrimidine photo-lyase, partial [Rhodobacteraceae bacterium B1Z28]|nr:deoxyribodipyrimidine photo-lyase [Ruegeria haliotis]
MEDKIAVFWFRRDLRLEDNVALHHALNSGFKVLPIFIFDEEIINTLPKQDARITFIYKSLKEIDNQLKTIGSSLRVLKGEPLEIWDKLVLDYKVKKVFFNKDYEPYALKRDESVKALLKSKGIETHTYKDQVIFEADEVLKANQTPYTVYTPYKNQWLKQFDVDKHVKLFDCQEFKSNFVSVNIN